MTNKAIELKRPLRGHLGKYKMLYLMTLPGLLFFFHIQLCSDGGSNAGIQRI